MGLIFTDRLHFFTDKPFWCGKYPEFENVRLFNIIGPGLEEKGKIIHILSDIFSESRQELYYSPYDRSFPCAVYLPEHNCLAVSGFPVRGEEKLSCRYFDIARILRSDISPAEEIVGYTMSQSNAYRERSLELISVADLLLREYLRSSREVLRSEELKSYAIRKIRSMLEKRDTAGTERVRALSAITCCGYRFANPSGDFTVMRLCDDYMAASRCFVKAASAAANKMGYDTIISYAADSGCSQMHLLIPEAGLMFYSESEVLRSGLATEKKLSLNRFYSRELLDSREHSLSFLGEYIRKIYSEAALNARICMDIRNQGRKLLSPYASADEASEIASEIVYGILNP